MQIKGFLRKIRFQKPDSNWGIFIVEYTDSTGNKIQNNFTGVIPKPDINHSYMFEGELTTHPTYGEQFKFYTCIPIEDETEDGILTLLSSKRFKGIGPKKASEIVKAFGKETLQIIRNDPMRLTEISGISEKTAKEIANNMPDIGTWGELRMLLRDSTDSLVNKIYEVYENQAITKIKANPYNLIKDIDGIGFLKADSIAKQLNITGNHPLRIQAAIFHILEQAAEMDGHCFSYASNLQANVQKFVPEASVEDIAEAIKVLADKDEKNGRMSLHIDEDGAIYLSMYWRAEVTIAQKVSELLSNKKRNFYTNTMIRGTMKEIMKTNGGYDLEEKQYKAVETALNEHLCVITGGPGTGKTTIVNAIIKTIETKGRKISGKTPKILLMAPTGRASKRITETTGKKAHTIAFTLVCAENKTIDCDYLICDETSMVNILTAQKIMSRIDSSRTHIIFLGDIDQLPAIGAGSFFKDLLQTPRIPVVKLEFSFRQNGSLAKNANSINHGMGPHSYIEDEHFQYIKATKDTAANLAIENYLSMVADVGINNTILLSPTRKNGNNSTNALNGLLQKILNPSFSYGKTIKTPDFVIGVNDRVLLTKNNVIENYVNGDVGTVINIKETTIDILFDGEDNICTANINEIQNVLTLAYALTIHKVQGSEYKNVIMLFTTEHSFMGQRALVYTGVTRAKDKMTLIGDARAIAIAVNKVPSIERNSKLKSRMYDEILKVLAK